MKRTVYTFSVKGKNTKDREMVDRITIIADNSKKITRAEIILKALREFEPKIKDLL